MSSDLLGLIINNDDDQACIFDINSQKEYYLAKTGMDSESWYQEAWGKVVFANDILVSFELAPEYEDKWNARLEEDNDKWSVLVDVYVKRLDVDEVEEKLEDAGVMEDVKEEEFEDKCEDEDEYEDEEECEEMEESETDEDEEKLENMKNKQQIHENELIEDNILFLSQELGFVSDSLSKFSDLSFETNVAYSATIRLSLKQSDEGTVLFKDIQEINSSVIKNEPHINKIESKLSGVIEKKIMKANGATRMFIYSTEHPHPFPVVLYKDEGNIFKRPKVARNYNFKFLQFPRKQLRNIIVEPEVVAVQLRNKTKINQFCRIHTEKDEYLRTEVQLLEIRQKMKIPRKEWSELSWTNKIMGEVSITQSLLKFLLTNEQIRYETVMGNWVQIWFRFKRTTSVDEPTWTASSVNKIEAKKGEIRGSKPNIILRKI